MKTILFFNNVDFNIFSWTPLCMEIVRQFSNSILKIEKKILKEVRKK